MRAVHPVQSAPDFFPLAFFWSPTALFQTVLHFWGTYSVYYWRYYIRHHRTGIENATFISRVSTLYSTLVFRWTAPGGLSVSAQIASFSRLLTGEGRYPNYYHHDIICWTNTVHVFFPSCLPQYVTAWDGKGPKSSETRLYEKKVMWGFQTPPPLLKRSCKSVHLEVIPLNSTGLSSEQTRIESGCTGMKAWKWII